MGELADRLRAASVSTIGPFMFDGLQAESIARAVEALEQRVVELESRIDYEAPIDIDRDDIRTRLVAAERKAEQAWAAVTLMAARDEACIGVHQGAPSTMEYVDSNGNPYRSALLNYVPVHCVTAVFAVNAPANPDLLERASVELAEAYQRAKAEEQRQAERDKVAR